MDLDDQARLERSARNEALWREVNDRIAEIDAEMRVLPAGELLQFHCECGNAACTSRVSITPVEYGRVREETDRFAVAPGHEQLEIERVVDRSERYFVVDKLAAVERVVGGDGIPSSGA